MRAKEGDLIIGDVRVEPDHEGVGVEPCGLAILAWGLPTRVLLGSQDQISPSMKKDVLFAGKY